MSGVPKSSDPTFYMLGGGPAAGKSTLIERGDIAVPSVEKKQAVLVNPDVVKESLPEYKPLVDKTNLLSSHMRNLLLFQSASKMRLLLMVKI
jgi:hypothetical protein